MTRRGFWRLVKGVILALVLLLLLFAAGICWVLGTATGARWALSQIPGLQVAQVHGNLVQGLTIRQLSYVHAGTRAQIQTLSWHLAPQALFWGEVSLSQLSLRHARLQIPQSTPSTVPLSLQWPDLPTWLRTLHLRVQKGQLEDVQFQEGTSAPIMLQGAHWKALTWFLGNLTISNLQAQGSFGRLHLNGKVGLWSHAITARALWHAAAPASQDQASLILDWPSQLGAAYGGKTELTWHISKTQGTLKGALHLSPYGVNLQKLVIHSPTLPAPVGGELDVELPHKIGGDFQTQGHLQGAIVPTSFSHYLKKDAPLAVQWQVQGNASHYRGQAQVASVGTAQHLLATVQGNAGAATVDIGGELLGAAILQRKIQVAWHPQIRVSGALGIRHLLLQRLSPQLTGNLSTDVQFQAEKAVRGWQGTVKWQLLPSQFRAQPLQGQGTVSWQGSQWQLGQSVIRGPGLLLSADGNLQKRLQLKARLGTGQFLLPQYQGTTTMTGWVARTGQRWQGSLQLLGNDLRYQSTPVQHLALQGTLSPQQIIHAQLQANGLVVQKVPMQIQGALDGSLQSAALKIGITSKQGGTQLQAKLTHQGQIWQAQIPTWDWHLAQGGAWHLTHTASVEWTGGQLALSHLDFGADNGAHLNFSGSYGPGAQRADLDLQVVALPMDFHSHSLDGGLRGHWDAHIQGACQGDCTLHAHFALQGGQMSWIQDDSRQELPIPEFSGHIAWDKQGLASQATLLLGEHLGHLQVEAKSPATLSLPWTLPKAAPLHAQIVGSLPGKLLAQLPSGTVHVDPTGDVRVDLEAGGTWASPQWHGQAHLQGLGAFLPAAGLHLKNISGSLLGTGDHLEIDHLVAHSGDGELQMQGTMGWAHGYQFHATLTGNQFLAINLPQVRASVDPNLQIQGSSKGMAIHGKIETTKLRILGTDFGGPKPSGDVVFVRQQHQTQSSFPLTANIDVGLGKNAKVIIGGLHADLEGSLHLAMTPKGGEDLNGTLQMVNGQYQIYGNTLHFLRGKILFSGSPKAATLDVLAVRNIKTSNSFAVDNQPIEAGVSVTGTLVHPVVNLYSRPSMAQNDILSYLVLGTSSSNLQNQDALLSAAAGQLFSAGRAAVFGQGLNSGFDFGVSSSGEGGLSNDMVTLGHYITPDLYFSVGQSILGQGTVARLRYRVSRHVEIQTESGTQDGANVFYRIDF